MRVPSACFLCEHVNYRTLSHTDTVVMVCDAYHSSIAPSYFATGGCFGKEYCSSQYTYQAGYAELNPALLQTLKRECYDLENDKVRWSSFRKKLRYTLKIKMEARTDELSLSADSVPVRPTPPTNPFFNPPDDDARRPRWAINDLS